MCTLTIHFTTGRMDLTMNRDVLRTRPAATLPEVHAGADGGADWLGPTDPPSGGTWVGVNEAGLVAALLNHYPPGAGPVVLDYSRPARGGLVPALLAQPSFDAADAWLTDAFAPDRYPPFEVVIADRGQAAIYQWDETPPLRRIESAGPWRLAASSGWRTAEVLDWRRRHFEQWLADGERHAGPLPTFHAQHLPGREAYGPLLDRPDACTRSITRIELSPDLARMLHWAEPLVQGLDAPHETALPLRA